MGGAEDKVAGVSRLRRPRYLRLTVLRGAGLVGDRSIQLETWTESS